MLEILREFEGDFAAGHKIIAAKVNNVCQGLKYRAFNSRQVEFLDYTSYTGRNVYCSSLCFLLSKAVKDVFEDCRLILRRPVSKGYYCQLVKKDGSAVCQADIDAIMARMRELVAADLPFRRHEVRTEDAIAMFENLGYEDKVRLLQTAGDVYVNYYTLDGTPDYYYEALLPSTGYISVWDLSLYKGGMHLRVPDRHNPDELAPMKDQPKTFEVLSESLRWNKIMGLDNVGDVNLACRNGQAKDLIAIAEALQEKKIVQIAEEAATLGIELMVMDDGWFGKRDNDKSGLGDWIPNEKKLQCTLNELGERICSTGMRFGIWFGAFQALMPLLGYLGAISFQAYIVDYDHWIAFALLGYLGWDMISEASDSCSIKKSYTTKEMLVLAIATSIDALAVGVSFAFLQTNIWLAVALIGVVTFAFSFVGGLMGFKLGVAVGKKANIFGGVVLICIGVKILLEHTGFL